MNEKESKSKLGGKADSSKCKDDYLSALGVCEKVGLIPKIVDSMYHVRYKVKDLYWKCRYGLQRMFRGYDDIEIYSTYSEFIKRYTKILTRLKKNHVGYPYYITNEKWEQVIDDMLTCLYYMDDDNVTSELEKNAEPGKRVYQRDVCRIMERNKNEFFRLFSKYFYDLWD